MARITGGEKKKEQTIKGIKDVIATYEGYIKAYEADPEEEMRVLQAENAKLNRMDIQQKIFTLNQRIGEIEYLLRQQAEMAKKAA